MTQQNLLRWGKLVVGAAMCLAAGILLTGCGGTPEGQKLVRVTGKVTYKGQPLAKGRVTFMPLAPGNSSSGAVVNGIYKLSTYKPDDGAPPGSYKVAVTSWTKEPDMQSEGEPAIPKRYFSTDTSQLTAEVGKQPAIDFELQD